MCGRTSEISASHGATVSLLMVIYLIRYPLTSNDTEEIRFAYTIPVDRAYRWVGLPMLTHVKLMINEALLVWSLFCLDISKIYFYYQYKRARLSRLLFSIINWMIYSLHFLHISRMSNRSWLYQYSVFKISCLCNLIKMPRPSLPLFLLCTVSKHSNGIHRSSVCSYSSIKWLTVSYGT